MWARWRSLLAGLTRRARVERDLDAELAFHLQAEAERQEQRGLPPDEALRRARLQFGPAARIREECREARGLRLADELAADLRFAGRLMRRSPLFTMAAVLTLALAIGANTAIFSLVDTILLRSLPVERPHELVFLEVRGSQGGGGAPPYPCFVRIRDDAGFAGVAAFAGDELRVRVDGRLEQVFGQVASGNYFEVLGVEPALGRLLTIDDERLDPAVAVIGHGYWQRRFGGAPDVIGRTVTHGGRVFTIVGVTRDGFRGLQPGRELDLTIPVTHERAMTNADTWWLDAVARVRPGVPASEAGVRANTIFQAFMNEHDRFGEMRRTHFDRLELRPASRGLDRLRTRFGAPLTALMALAGAVLLIACANLVNLLRARGAARARELAIRLAAGAGRGRLVRQLLTETLVLFAAGAAAGLALAWFAVRALAGFVAIGRQPILLDVRLDWRVAAFAGGIALVAGLATGLWPAVRALGSDPQAAMKDGLAGLSGARRSQPGGRALIVGQVALSLVLTTTAVFFAQTLANLRSVDLGFRETRVLTMSLDPVLGEGAPAGARAQFWASALERVQTMPGVRAASLSVLTPLSGRDVGKMIEVAGFTPQSRADRTIHLNHVSADYFQVFGIHLLAGRTLTANDVATAPKVLVLNEAAARFYFPGRSAVGETIDFGRERRYTVVGVVASQKHMNLRQPAQRFAFVPLGQLLDPVTRITLSVASAQSIGVLARETADRVRSVHAETLVSDVIPVQEQIDATLVSERLVSTLGGAFAALAVALAAIGLYGVLSYSVTRRRAEFGVRLALGAPPAQVAWEASRHTLRHVVLGLALGLPAAVFVARRAQTLFFGVAPADAGAYIISAAVLAVVAILAVWAPSRRASHVNPVSALREG